MIDHIKFLELSKKECIEGGKITATQCIDEGKEDVLNAYLWAKGGVEFLKSFIETTHEQAMIEWEKHGEKEVELHGRNITRKEVGVKWDYSKCGLPEYEDLINHIESKIEARKELETKLKAMIKKETILDEDTGEMIEVLPAIRKSTTSLIVKY